MNYVITNSRLHDMRDKEYQVLRLLSTDWNNVKVILFCIYYFFTASDMNSFRRVKVLI